MTQNQKKHAEKLRHGSFSLVLTIAVVAFCIVCNVLLSALANVVELSVDLTGDALFSVSDATIAQLSATKEQSYTIHFCKPLDELTQNAYTQLIYACAKQFADKMDNVTIDYLDIFRYPALAEKYKRSASDTVLSTDVIVENANGMYRKFARDAFFVRESEESTSFYAFNGEFKLASAFLQLAGLYNPVASFTIGHGETQPTALMQLFEDAGYTVKTVNLRTEQPDPYTKVMVIYDPLYDFIGENSDGTQNEITVLDDYLLGQNALMVFCDPQTPHLPQLYEYLEEWGISFGNTVIQDSASSASADGLSVIATLPTEGTGASLHSTMRQLASQPIVVAKDATPVYSLFTSKNQRTVSSVLSTTKSAVSIAADNTQSRGQYDLMTLSRETRVVDNESVYSHVLACGSTGFVQNTYLLKNSYGNRDILYAAMNAFNRDMVPIDISYKYFDDNSISISTTQANTWLIALSIVIPAAVLITGSVVWIRRRHL